MTAAESLGTSYARRRQARHGLLSAVRRFVAGLIALLSLTGVSHAANESLFGTQVPSFQANLTLLPQEYGVKFQSSKPGQITAIRFWKSFGDFGAHTGRLWNAAGTQVASVNFSGETLSGWQQQALSSPVTISPNTTYVVSVNASTWYPTTVLGLAKSVVSADLSTIADGRNGVYGSAGRFPTGTSLSTNYFRDVVFVPAPPTIAKASGDAQSGTVNTVLANPLVVQIKDGLGNPQAGTTVSFAVTSSATATVFYGSGNQYLSRSGLSGNVACSNTGFGIDPTYGVVKSCGYVFTPGSVAAGSTACAVDGGTCALPAGTTAKVYYGSGSTYLVRSGVTASFVCLPASFGGVDPVPGVVKSCSYVATATAANAGTTACASENGTCTIPVVPTATVSPASVATNAGGLASTTVTLGNAPGTTTIVATAAGIGSVTYTATAVAPPAISKLSGDGQTAAAGTPLPSPFVVQVRDGSNAPVAGAVVAFSVTAGGGALSAANVTTNASGQASTTLTLGPTAGVNTVHAAALGGAVDFTATATATVTGKLALASSGNGVGSLYTPLTYTASLLDLSGNPVTTSGVPVTFSVSGGTAMFAPDSTVATTGGSATVTVVPTSAGSFALNASSPGLTSAATTLVIATAPLETIFTSQTPTAPNFSDGTTYELGTKFTAKQAGRITAVRYWKAPSETGTHTGTIWSATGAPLASVAFVNETGSGWQQQALATPLPIAANTTYVVSTNVNAYYVSSTTGLATSVVNADLATVADGANGVYGSPGVFPTNSFSNSNYFRDVVFIPGAAPVATVLVPLAGDRQSAAPATTLTAPLTVQVRSTAGTPVVGTTVTFAARVGGGSVTTASAVTDLNGEAATPAKLGALAGVNSFHAAASGIGSIDFAAMADASGAKSLAISPTGASTVPNSAIGYLATVLDAAGYTVTGATAPVTFSATGVAGSFSATSVTPKGGQAATTFRPTASGTATVSAAAGGLTGAGTTLAVAATATPETVLTTQTPANPNATDNVTYELGMKFQSARSGQITGIDYWKAASETGTHTGRIWSAGGALLATVTFAGETASGWQRQALATPLSIQANTTYVVSVNVNAYYALTPSGLSTAIVNGDLSSVADGLNGVFGAAGSFPASSFQSANYFRDVNFVPDQVPQLAKVSGDLQAGTPGTALAQPLAVQVVGSNGLPQAGVTVNFAVTAGGGSVSPAVAVTDAGGIARSALTMGAVAGRNAVSASTATAGSVTFSALVPNAIYLENLNAGTPGAVAALTQHYTSTGIAGYADALSVNRGDSLPLRVSIPAAGTYTVDVYRLGWYGGAGARLMSTSGALNGTTQPPCVITDATTHLVECSWSVTYTVAVGTTWTSGLYMARLTNNTTGQMHPVFFIVRDDASHSDILFQSSRTTAIAYGSYGTPTAGYSLYGYNSTGGLPAQKVSLDRPSSELQEFSNLLNHEYPMARWLESQGYDVSYVTNLDLHTGGAAVLQSHKLFLSVGHDEYWSLEMRNAAEQARDAGVNLGFFSGNSAYWRVRFEPSSSGVANRVMVCYKDPVATPDPIAPTYRWRDPQNNRPENAMMGVQYIGDNSVLYAGFDFVAANTANNPLYANTGLTDGAKLSALVGYEWDAISNNGFSPAGVTALSASPVTATTVAPGEQDPSGVGAQISNAAYYTAASGAKVFALGSIQWVWGLDSYGVTPPRVDPRAQQFAVNLLANGGARPLNPAAGLVVP